MNENLRPAALVNRVFASILDTLLMLIIQFSFGFIIMIIDRNFPIPANLIDLSVSLLTLATSLIVFIYPMTKNGTTPGKWLLKIRVQDFTDGEFLTWPQAIIREFFAKLVTLLLFPIAIIMYMMNHDKRFIHDLICRSRVVSLE